jgi:hypothetical protein
VCRRNLAPAATPLRGGHIECREHCRRVELSSWATSSDPFVVDVTSALHAGKNQLEVKVTNLWTNRIIGDKQPGAQRIAYSTFDPYKADSPLLPSGLLGPVTLSRVSLP